MESISGENGWCSPSPLSNWPLPNVWLGVSVEDQAAADERIPKLLATPAAVRFLSCEPLIEEVDLRTDFLRETGVDWPWGSRSTDHIGWVIVGGESGPGARPCDLAWIRGIVGQCKAAGVPVFVKQAGGKPIESSHVDLFGPDGKRHYTRPQGDPLKRQRQARRAGRTR